MNYFKPSEKLYSTQYFSRKLYALYLIDKFCNKDNPFIALSAVNHKL
jgi:hypothetical protein